LHRHAVHDASLLDSTIDAITSQGGYAVAPCINNAQDVADAGFHMASVPFHDPDDDDKWFDRLDNNALDFPWDRDTLHDRFELATPRDWILLMGTSNVDFGTDQHNHVTLRDLELYSLASEQDDATAPLSGYEDGLALGYGTIEPPTQDLAMDSTIVLQPLQSPRRSHHDRHRGRNGDDRRTHNRVGPRPSAVIRDWYFTHSSSPYPSPEEIAALATLSGKSEHQVKICLSNFRARPKTGKYA
jgi:hypothetical protein